MNEITEPVERGARARRPDCQFVADIRELDRALAAGDLVVELDPLEQLESDLRSFLDRDWLYCVTNDLELEDVRTQWHVTTVGETHRVRIAIEAVVRPAT